MDTARLFPPTTPIESVQGCHLYKLFRPEYLRKFVKGEGLSSDAFSFFGMQSYQKFNSDVEKATYHLIHHVIPNFACMMDERTEFITQENLKGKN